MTGSTRQTRWGGREGVRRDWREVGREVGREGGAYLIDVPKVLLHLEHGHRGQGRGRGREGGREGGQEFPGEDRGRRAAWSCVARRGGREGGREGGMEQEIRIRGPTSNLDYVPQPTSLPPSLPPPLPPYLLTSCQNTQTCSCHPERRLEPPEKRYQPRSLGGREGGREGGRMR